MKYPNIAAERVRRGLSQDDLAREMRVTRKTIYNWEVLGNIPASSVGKLADFFGVSADYLLGLSDVKTQKTDVRAICRQTGLSEKAVQKISACCARRYLNRLLEEDNFYALANTLESLHMANRRLPFFDVDHFMQTEEAVKAQFGQEYDLLSPTDRVDMLRYDITFTGNELLNHLMEEAKRNGQKGK